MGRVSNPFSRLLVERSRCTFAFSFPWKTGALTTDYESSIRKIVEIAARALVFLGRNRQQCCSSHRYEASIRMHRAFERLARALPSLRIEKVDHPHPSSPLPVTFSFFLFHRLSPFLFLLRIVERTKSRNKFVGERVGLSFRKWDRGRRSQLFTCTYFKIGTCNESRVATVYDNISSAVT